MYAQSVNLNVATAALQNSMLRWKLCGCLGFDHFQRWLSPLSMSSNSKRNACSPCVRRKLTPELDVVSQ